MLKFTNLMVTFSEFPDEISLCINITGCKINCPECHSSYLAKDIGEPLYLETVYDLIDKNEGITCLGLMGGDAEPLYINTIAKAVKDLYDIKVGWYSGRDYLAKEIDLNNFDYIKLGPYVKDKGPLNSKTTNQIMLKIDNSCGKPITTDITSKFWK